jgi:hypothetical protein
MAMLNHAERVWELDTQNPRSNHRAMYPPCTIYHTHKSPLTRIESFLHSC